MSPTLRTMIQKITPQVNLRPAGVWDFMSHPGHATGFDQQIEEFERLWRLAEREAYATGETHVSATAN